MDHSKPEGHRPFPGRGKPFLREFGMELVESQTWPKLKKSAHTPLDPEFCMHQTANQHNFCSTVGAGCSPKAPKVRGAHRDGYRSAHRHRHPSGCQPGRGCKKKDVEWKKSKNDGVHIAHSGKFRHPEAHQKGGLQETIRQGPVCLLHWKNESPRKRAPVSRGDKP